MNVVHIAKLISMQLNFVFYLVARYEEDNFAELHNSLYIGIACARELVQERLMPTFNHLRDKQSRQGCAMTQSAASNKTFLKGPQLTYVILGIRCRERLLKAIAKNRVHQN